MGGCKRSHSKHDVCVPGSLGTLEDEAVYFLWAFSVLFIFISSNPFGCVSSHISMRQAEPSVDSFQFSDRSLKGELRMEN